MIERLEMLTAYQLLMGTKPGLRLAHTLIQFHVLSTTLFNCVHLDLGDIWHY